MRQINDKLVSDTYAYDKGYADGYGKGYHDAWEKLKEQEPVKPELRMSKHGFRQWIVCGNCYGKMHGLYDYCPWCGKAVKWDADTE